MLDPRVKNMPFMNNPNTTALITVLYLAIVFYGPKIMRDRKPFHLKNVLHVYNLTTSLLSGYLVFEVNYYKYGLTYD
jgi:elongation of very long chain fatty acids protein 4